MTNSVEREKRIIEFIKANGSASIQQLVEALGVSNMTIHRDLNKLAEKGLIVKKHGGAVLVSETAEERSSVCDMCQKPVSLRTVFLVQLANGEEKRACCAHCGLMMQSREENLWQSLTADYLRGYMVSAGQAVYLIGSELNICCIPSVLAFGSRSDAEKFQKGFGGQILDMGEALQHLYSMMHMRSGM